MKYVAAASFLLAAWVYDRPISVWNTAILCWASCTMLVCGIVAAVEWADKKHGQNEYPTSTHDQH